MNQFSTTMSPPTTCSEEAGGDCKQNIATWEQGASLVAGGGLAWYGLKRGELLALLAGGALICRGWTGHCSAYQFLGIDSSDQSRPRTGVRNETNTLRPEDRPHWVS